MAIAKWLGDACDSIDAGFFSGDTLHSREAIAAMNYYMRRWMTELRRIEEMLDEQDTNTEEAETS